MKWLVTIVLCAAALLVALANAEPEPQFRQFFNNNNNNRNNFLNFRPNNNNRNNNNNNRNNNQVRGTNPNFAFGLDTSDGRYAKFDGPVKGIPKDHGGGRFGAADCLLCPDGGRLGGK